MATPITKVVMMVMMMTMVIMMWMMTRNADDTDIKGGDDGDLNHFCSTRSREIYFRVLYKIIEFAYW